MPDEDEKVMAPGQSGVRPTGDACYEAFISYSHTETDTRVAREVQRFIEGFSIPRGLRDRAGRPRLGKVFRDEDELDAGMELSGGLERALKNSKWLIVICSPAAAASPWVAREIEMFVSVHGAGQVLAVLANGEPLQAFPTELATCGRPDGARGELVAADLRPSRRYSVRRMELLRIAAPLIGCSFDSLVQRQRARRRRKTACLAVVVCACLALFGGIAYVQHQRVMSAESASAAGQARRESLAAYAEGDRVEALRLALEGASSKGDPVQEAQARQVISEVLGVYHGVVDTMPLYAVHDVVDASTLTVGKGKCPWFSLVESVDRIEVYELESGAMVCEFSAGDVEVGCAFSGYTASVDGYLLAALDGGGMVCFDVSDSRVAWHQAKLGWVLQIEELNDGRLLALEQGSDTLSLVEIETSTGDVLRGVNLGEPKGETVAMAALGNRAAVTCGDRLYMVEIDSGAVSTATLHAGGVSQLTMDGNTIYAVSSEISSENGSEDTWAGRADVCAYSWGSGSLCWNFERTWDGYPVDFSSLPFNCDACMLGVESSEALGCDVLPIAMGDAALLVDTKTGWIVTEIEAVAPIVQLDYVNSSDGEVLRQTSFTGDRGVARVAAGVSSFVNAEPYGFSSAVWNVAEVQDGAVRYAVGCSAEHTGTILVCRDGLGLPDEPGVEGIEVPGEVTGISASSDRTHVAVMTDGGIIAILNGKDFEPGAAIDLKAVGIKLNSGSDVLVTFPDADSNRLIVCDPGAGDVPPRAWQFDATTGELLELWEFPYDIEGVSYDGSVFSSERAGYVTLSVSSAGYLAVMDAESFEVEQEFSPSDFGVTDAVRINGKRYLFVFESGFAGIYDSETMDMVGDGLDGLSLEAGCGMAQVAVAPDGSELAVVSPERGLVVVDASTGGIMWEVPCPATGKEFVGYIAGGAVLAVQDTNGRMLCFDASTGSLLAETDDVLGIVQEIGCSKGTVEDGVELYVRSIDGGITQTQAFDLREDSLTLAATMEDAWSVSPDGRYVLVGTDGLYRQPIYGLNELEEMARSEVEAFEGR